MKRGDLIVFIDRRTARMLGLSWSAELESRLPPEKESGAPVSGDSEPGRVADLGEGVH